MVAVDACSRLPCERLAPKKKGQDLVETCHFGMLSGGTSIIDKDLQKHQTVDTSDKEENPYCLNFARS